MAGNLKATWPAFQNMQTVELGLMLDGVPLGSPVFLPGVDTQHTFYALHNDQPARYACNVRGITAIIPATITSPDPPPPPPPGP